MAALILETSFLIDLEREARRGDDGPAQRFLETHAADRLHLTFTTAGELAAGASLGGADAWRSFVGRFHVLASSAEVCLRYGRLYRFLEANGLLIGGNDLWIAATALAYELPLVTRDEEHFRRVPELEVIGYG